jgi:hypothetical protein
VGLALNHQGKHVFTGTPFTAGTGGGKTGLRDVVRLYYRAAPGAVFSGFWVQTKREPLGANRRVLMYRLASAQYQLRLSSESGSHRQPLAACRSVGDFLVSTPQALTNPLDALLLGRVRRWVAVVFRQKSKCGQLDRDGRPWTRLPAKDLARQLEEQEGLEVSVRRIQRSLVRLEEAGYLARQQRGIWRRDFWYSFPDAEWELQQHRPVAVAAVAKGHGPTPPRTVTLAKDPSRRHEASAVTALNLDIPSNNQNLSRTERKTASQFDGESACADRKGASGDLRTQPHRQMPTGTLQGRLSALGTLKQVVQRATARGFGGNNQPNDPQVTTPNQETWVEGEYRFTRLESGHVVADPLATAPLR